MNEGQEALLKAVFLMNKHAQKPFFEYSWALKHANLAPHPANFPYKLFLPTFERWNLRSCWDIWGMGANNLFHSSTKTILLEETQNSRTSLQDDGRPKNATHKCKNQEWRLILIPHTRTQKGPDSSNIFWALHVKKMGFAVMQPRLSNRI